MIIVRMQLKKELLEWYKGQLQEKNIFLGGLEELSSGYYFLEVLHNFHPKSVDLSKVFLKPKNEYEVLQNYKLLSGSFVKLGWKKFEAERYSKRREKDYLSLAQVLRKVLSTRSIKEGLLQGHLDTTLEEFRSEEEASAAPRHNQLRALRIARLEKAKKDLLAKLTRLQLLLASDDPDRPLPALQTALLAIIDGADSPN